MHDLIFETSILLLAGSTGCRPLTTLPVVACGRPRANMVVKLRGKRASRQVGFKAAEIPRPGGIEITPFIPCTASERTVSPRVQGQTATLRDSSGTRTSP